MFGINKKNEQEKFNERMNIIMKELEDLSYVEVLARIAAFNKQSKTFQLKISSKKESNLDEFIRDAGTIADETINKFKKEILPVIKNKSNEVTETMKDVKDKTEVKIKEQTITREFGGPWTSENVAMFLRIYIKSRNPRNGKYDPEIKEKVSKQFSINENNLTNKANFFCNQIIKGEKYQDILTDNKLKNIIKKEEILRFKFRDVKYCKDLVNLPDYKELSKEDKDLLREAIKRENGAKNN